MATVPLIYRELSDLGAVTVTASLDSGQTAIGLNLTSTFSMQKSHKSKPSGGTPPPTPRFPAKLVQELTSRKDLRALAAASSAIALSIGSASNDTSDTSSDGDTVQAMDEIRKTTYAAVRMAVDITKESSDMCLPLKAVVGAISALIKNYDVSPFCSRAEQSCLTMSPFPALANVR